jgi:hypothetical protein
MLGLGFAMFGAQWVKQIRQTVVVDLLHQRQQSAQFPVRKTLASEPVQVLPGKVGQDSAFVFAERHLARDQQFELLRIHGLGLDSVNLENTGILHAGQMTDHANNADTVFLFFTNLLIIKCFVGGVGLARPMQYSL